MIQNLKVDVIYHQTPSDFEMEFNLCGCCRMRLLNDKTTDKKSFVKSLAKAVSRSKIIIACGPLFGDDGLINTVSIAIGNGTATCDNATYGILSDEPIKIIKGSTPLVTPNGYFGGCIIESGPQTIILLTENKAFRKEIMQNLIHPYIEEVCYGGAKQPEILPQPKSPVTESVTQTDEAVATPNDDFIMQTDNYENDTEYVDSPYEAARFTEDEHNIEFIMDDASADDKSDGAALSEPVLTTDVADTFANMYVEVEKPEEIKRRYETPYTQSEADGAFITTSEVDDDFQAEQKKINRLDITIIILVILLLLAVASLVYLLLLKPHLMGISTVDYIKMLFNSSDTAVSVI